MKAHILITNKETFPICRDRLIWGVGIEDIPEHFNELVDMKNSRKPYLKMLVDMLGIRKGDLVFLYERQVGFHGVYKVNSDLFWDTSDIVDTSNGNIIGKQWPLRICLECVNYFPNSVPEDLLFSTPKYENDFWIWAYRKVQGPRGCNTITNEAAESLIELLVKVNTIDQKYANFNPYQKPQQTENVFLPLNLETKRVELEDILRGYLIGILDKNPDDGLYDIFGPMEDIEWSANNVPYHITQKNIDILCFHKTFKYTGLPFRYKYSVIELKKDISKPIDVTQLIRYSQWAASRLANGELEMIQPILIAAGFQDDTIRKAKESDFNQRGIKLFQYEVVSNNKLKFKKL